MKLETWAAIAALGLAAMSAAIMVSFYSFLVGPDHKGLSTQVDAASLVVQEVSISAIPCSVIAIFVFFMGRGYGNAGAGILLVATGAVMAAGMAAANSLVPQIQHQYLLGGVPYFPIIFVAVGIVIMGLGAYLIVLSKRRRAQSLEDLR